MSLGSKPLKRVTGWLILVVSEGRSLMKLVLQTGSSNCYRKVLLLPALKSVIRVALTEQQRERPLEAKENEQVPPVFSSTLLPPIFQQNREQLAMQKCGLQRPRHKDHKAEKTRQI